MKNCDVFFACFLSCFGMTKFVITETLWSSISFKTIMVSLHRGRFVVVHRCSSFPIDPKNFSRGANFYQKLPFLAIFGAVRPNFKATMVKFGMRVRSWGSLPQEKFCKNDLREYTPLGKIYTKNYNFWRFFWAVRPHLSSQNGKNLAWGANLGDPPPCQILQKLVKEVYPFLEKLYQKLAILAILTPVSPHL